MYEQVTSVSTNSNSDVIDVIKNVINEKVTSASPEVSYSYEEII